jgi:hypothetical protein
MTKTIEELYSDIATANREMLDLSRQKAAVEARRDADRHALREFLIQFHGYTVGKEIRLTDGREARISGIYLDYKGELIATCFTKNKTGEWGKLARQRVLLVPAPVGEAPRAIDPAPVGEASNG